MKRALTLLLSLAAAAHAQFAVMHTNGVVTSPTNFTIQQSNVAGLSNALAGKLATNGSAAGLTGFVGTTNAETARGNLGISNTFSGQFHADFYDDFSRYSNGTQFTNGASPVIGSNYILRSGVIVDGTQVNNFVVPFITNGVLTSTNTLTNTWYLNTELSRPVYNFGIEWSWENDPTKNIDLAWPVIIIRPNDQWLNKLLHIVISPLGVGVDVSVSGGAGGFVTISTTDWGASFARLERGVRHVLSGEIEGNTLRMRLAGRSIEVTDARIGEVNGPFFTFEYFGNNPTTNVANINWHRVWANSPNMMQYASQPFSERLLDFANGDARVTRYLSVGTNKSDYLNNRLSTDFPVFVDGGAVVDGILRNSIGTSAQYGDVPSVHQRGGGMGNTNTTNLTALVTFSIISDSLYTNWSRWKGTFVGSFADNTNAKRVTFNMAGTRLDTGDLNETGEWKMEALVYRSTTNSHEGFAIFQSEQTTKTTRWVFNNGPGTTFEVSARGAAVSNNEVILRGAWTDWFP